MKIVSRLCLSLSQLLEVPSMPGLGPSTAENPLDVSQGRGQRFAGLPAVLRVSDGEQSRCPGLLPPFLVFVIPVPVSGSLQADVKPPAEALGPQ